jgi:hypothetical protein
MALTFRFCAKELPRLAPGQILLLPLRNQAKDSSEPWQLAGVEGYGITTRVAEVMEGPPLAASDSRSFIIRELANSLSRGDPMARFTASSIAATQATYLEPEFTAQLERSMGGDRAGWAQVLGSVLVSYPDRPLTFAEVRRPRGTGLAAIQECPSRTACLESPPWRGSH